MSASQVVSNVMNTRRRGFVVRQKIKSVRTEYLSARRIQTCARKCLARWVVSKARIERDSAVKIQSIGRARRDAGVVERMRLEKKRGKEETAAVLVQCGIRSSLARSAVLELREQRSAAIKLQTRARMR